MRSKPHPLPRRHRLSPLAQAITVAGLLATPLWLQAQTGPKGLPSGLQVVQGQASVATQGTQMTVKNGAGAILNWQSFSIGAANGVHFEQAGAASKVLNRVIGNDPSAIFGSLTSNGQVWLLNPNGVLFGPGARVDVAGLVASTLRLNDNDFLAGRYRFSAAEGEHAGIRNEGALTSSFGGHVVLLGASVENAGRVSAPGGRVSLAAARSVELVDTGLPHLTVKVKVAAGEVLNLGALAAAGGTIDVYGGIVNQQGLVRADTLGADATGRIVLHAADMLTLGAASRTLAQGLQAGASGGAVDLLGAQIGVLGKAVVDVSGVLGGGGVRVGGGVQGQDLSVPNARAVYFGPEAVLRADATGEGGNGGRIVLWSNEATRAYGTLSARGGRVAGDGGFVETSGGWLDARPVAVDVAARGGRAGNWLLDPNNILINNTGPDTNISGGPVFTSSNDNSVIGVATIAAALNAGTSVTVATGTGGNNAQPGDILVDAATLNVAPSAGVTLTLQAARDIVVGNSSITSTGQALSLDFVAAGSGIGAIEIRNSTITTAGGNVTLGGAISQQLPLPGGGLTALAYKPATGYQAGNAASLTTSGGQIGVHVHDSTLTLGSGNFTATGFTPIANVDAVAIGGATGTTNLSAARIDIVGASFVAQPIGIDLGVHIRGNSTNLTATQGIAIEGAGAAGVEIADGARIALNAAPASGAVVKIVGHAGVDVGVALLSDNFGIGSAGRGTRITVNNASLQLSADSTSNVGLAMLNNDLAPGPLLDLGNASSASFTVPASGGQTAIVLNDVELVLPGGGATSFTANRDIRLARTQITGNGGSLNFSAQGVLIDSSLIASSGTALALGFATTGAAPTGVYLLNSIVDTAGGDVRFGASQVVCSTVLSCTAAAGNWIESSTDSSNYSGFSIPAALWLEGSTIDAGSGRVYGGGAAQTAALGGAGVTLDGSIVRAREIDLAGRSEYESGINVAGGTYTATRVFSLDALSSAAGFYGMFVGNGATLRLSDPTAATGSGMSLKATQRSAGPALGLEGGNAGSTQETTIAVDGGTLLLQGTAAGGSDGSSGVSATGTAAVPGGLLINALGATGVTISAFNQGSLGDALVLSYMNLLGPQNAATSPLNITASGGRLTGRPSSVLTGITLSSAGPVRLLTDGLEVNGSRLSGDAGLVLHTNTAAGGRAAAPIAITGSTLEAAGVGAELRIEGSAGDNVRGLVGYNAGQGVTLTDSSLLASGAGARVVVSGRGSDSAGTGVVLTRSVLTATNLNLVGRGIFDGDGVVTSGASGTPTVVSATNLTVTGTSANSAISQTFVGVRLGSDTRLSFSGGGVAQIDGDTVLLGPAVTGAPFRAEGAAASFTVSSTGSQLLNAATLDFTAGTGTAVTLRADSDASGAGRLRLIDSTVLTGGGSFAGSGRGVYSIDAQGNALPFNTTVREGALGVFFGGSTRIDAGAGGISLNGTGALDGRSGTLGNSPGVGVQGSADLIGGNIVLVGSGGDSGAGIDTESLTPGSTLNLTAPAISVTGTGTGFASLTSPPNLGVSVGSSSWNAGAAGTLAISSLASGIAMSGMAVAAGTTTLNAAGPLTISGSGFTSAGAFTATAVGPTVNGSLFSVLNTSVNAGGALTMDATATTPGVALALLQGVVLTGGSVALSGTASGALSNAPGISAVAPAGSITATSGPLNLTGRNPALDTEGILLEGPWLLQAPNVINIVSDGTTLLRSPVGFSGSPSFSAAQAVNLTLNSPFGINLGDVASALDANTLGIALAGQSPTSTFTLTVSDPSGLLVDRPFSLPARLQVRAQLVAISATGSLTSTAPGDAIVLDGLGGNAIAFFDNQAGPGALGAPSGRWVVQLQDPASANLGGLGGNFTAYNLAAQPWAVDASGNLVTPATGNAIGYAVAPSVLTGTALAGLLSKVYDASTAITLNPLGWTLNGLLAGDTLTLTGATTATLADKNVGSGKAVTLNPASVFTVLDVGGNPVFGYDLPVFTATVTPTTLVLSGTVAANKVYDAGLAATLANAGSITPLAGDVVGLGAATASFADKNVGNAKPVTLTGLVLTGADAGNYTLLLPTGLTADITPLALALTGLTANSRAYDGSVLATLNGTAAVGALAGDSVLLAGSAAASFADKNAGTAKTVTVSGLTLIGVDAGNYALVQPAGFTADITPLALALTGLTANNKVYDGSTVAPLAGNASIAPLAGDVVTLAGAAAGSFGDKNVGSNKLVGIGGLTLAGSDAGNYQLAPPVGVNASITPAALTLAGVTAANKVYDATTAASASAGLGGLVAGDAVSATLAASFADANAGTAKAVSYSATTVGADAANYTLAVASGSTVADITPATLVYLANPLSLPAGSAIPLLTGSVTGFVGGQTLAGATTGALAFTTTATGSSSAGSYAIDGGGLVALNYQFVQAPGNASALTFGAAASADPATTANQVALMLGLQSVQVALAMSSPTEGRVLDVTPAFALGADGSDGEGLSFRAVNFSLMPRDEVQSLLAARASYKKKVFAGSLSKLELDPALADVPPCKTEAELDTGNCLVTEALKKEIEVIAARAAVKPRKADRRKVRQAALPNIERKLALLIGINKYDDKRVPELGGAVPDARAVRDLLEGRLGYETTVVENANRETLIRAFNKLAMEADANDSVIVYYAGHGEVVPVNGVDVGYWLPADVNPDEPKTWMSNSDIARMVAAIGARQLMLISDSCYSGTLAGSEKVQLDQRTDAADLLKRKAAVVLSSGGNEPVADEGRDGHSVFAWHFMRAIEGLDQWQVGTNVFERVRAAVVKDFPQTPQYGASRTAGHQGNTDYLFERREFEAVVPVPLPSPLTAPKR